ncbi:MAG TPA: biopolymer transporter ExbD [Bryobacteraceae bacterium]|nr:biopolymer transporter ExbD [Bryobacteraceae bacterium]
MGSGKTAADINVTPMIDILLVLLITFMLLPYHSKGLPAAAPDPAPEPSSAAADPLDVTLRIGPNRSMEINSQPVAPAELDARLRLVFASRPGGVLFVEGARELEFADVASVIDVARGAGVPRIGLITDRERP